MDENRPRRSPYFEEPEPPRGVATVVADGIRRIVAPNPSPMTYHGTNTYLVDTVDGLLVVDPGPDDASHTEAILQAAGGPAAAILLTHTHRDHVAGVSSLKAATGAPVAAFKPPQRDGFVPDVPLGDGENFAGLTAIHTPGHAADHLVFAREDGVLLSGDHVMSFSSSIVSPPDGNMTDYLGSLERLLSRQDWLYLPGHGPPISDPGAYVRRLLEHRRQREAEILSALHQQDWTLGELTARLYPGASEFTLMAGERSVLAHLLKLERENRASQREGLWVRN